MKTLFGEIDATQLEKKIVSEKVPCGTCVSTEYYLGGQLARRDIEVQVDRAPALDAQLGTL